MKRYIILFCISALIFSSCEEMRHAANNTWNKFEHNYCLANAKTAADSAACDRRYDEAVDAENDRHDNAMNTQNEVSNCEKFQKNVLQIWGYSDEEAKSGAKTIKKERNKHDFSFDCTEAIKELLNKGYSDKNGKQVFVEALPKFGLPNSGANEAIRQYYEDELYVDNDNPTHWNSPVDECLAHSRLGKHISVTKELLIEMDLLDEEEGDDEVDDEVGDDENTSTKPEPTTPDPDEPTDTYQIQANVISQMAISKYGFNEATLSSEQKQELDEVVAFMKKWPNATVTIIGHTCNIGSDNNNNIVGMRRAQQAKMYMAAHGIDENRINEVSKSAEEPCVSNDTEEGRLANRRITFIVK